MSKSSETCLTNLREILTSRFDEEELRSLCFDLNVDYDSLRGEGKAAKAREFVAYLERRNSIPELVRIGHLHRPDIPWNDLSGVSPSSSTISRLFLNLPDRLRLSIVLTAIVIGAVILVVIARMLTPSRTSSSAVSRFIEDAGKASKESIEVFFDPPENCPLGVDATILTEDGHIVLSIHIASGTHQRMSLPSRNYKFKIVAVKPSSQPSCLTSVESSTGSFLVPERGPVGVLP